MKIRANIKRTGQVKILRPYSYGYTDSTGAFYHKTAIELIEVLEDY